MSKKQRLVEIVVGAVELSAEDKKELKIGLMKSTTKAVELLMVLLKIDANLSKNSEAEGAAV